MSDDNKDNKDKKVTEPDGKTDKPDGGGKGDDPSRHADEELKKVIAQRDEAKRKARELEEQLKQKDDAERKAAEAKAIEEGKIKEILAAREKELEKQKQETADLTVKAQAYKDLQDKMREQLLGKIQDPGLRKIAERLPDVTDVQEFVDQLETKKITTLKDKAPTSAPDIEKTYKDSKSWRDALIASGRGT